MGQQMEICHSVSQNSFIQMTKHTHVLFLLIVSLVVYVYILLYDHVKFNDHLLDLRYVAPLLIKYLNKMYQWIFYIHVYTFLTIHPL